MIQALVVVALVGVAAVIAVVVPGLNNATSRRPPSKRRTSGNTQWLATVGMAGVDTIPRGAAVVTASAPAPVTSSPDPSERWRRSTTTRPVRVVTQAATSRRRDGFSTVITRIE